MNSYEFLKFQKQKKMENGGKPVGIQGWRFEPPPPWSQPSVLTARLQGGWAGYVSIEMLLSNKICSSPNFQFEP